MQEVVKLHQSGASIGFDVMQEGQQVIIFFFRSYDNTLPYYPKQLAEMRRLRTASGDYLITEGQDLALLPTSSSVSAADRESANKQYSEMQRGLLYLHDKTGIPPAVKNLDGEIRRDGELPVAGGSHSDIWQGRWLGEKKVRESRFLDSSRDSQFLVDVRLPSKPSGV